MILLVGSVLKDSAVEWQVTRIYFSQGSMKKHLALEPLVVSESAPFCLVAVHRGKKSRVAEAEEVRRISTISYNGDLNFEIGRSIPRRCE